MQEVEITSKKFWLDKKDLLKGALVAFLSSLFTAFTELSVQIATNGIALPTAAQLKIVLYVGLMTGAGYITKNFFTASHEVKKVE